MKWQQTDDKEDINPYHYRFICLTKQLNLNDLSQRYILGRAIYHIAQRRGFLSNRNETTQDTEGVVKDSINNLSCDIKAAHCQYLGEYFYKLYSKGERIRNHYTARKEHYIKEFEAICAKQNLDVKLSTELEKALFFQRPLKSQKGQVGTCTFEKNKSKCPASHPLFEEFRMLCFINGIKIKTPKDDKLRFLSKEERSEIIPLFYRKSKKAFPFADIAKTIAGKNNYGYYKTDTQKPYLFNYYMDTSISNCTVSAQLRDIFGENWVSNICECYTLANNKSKIQILNDIWHALFFFSDNDKLKTFAINRLQLEEEDATKFSKISIPNEYASLSLKAICKILPHLRSGMLYSHAVFLANLSAVVPSYIWNISEGKESVVTGVRDIINNYDTAVEARTLEQCIKDHLKRQFDLSDNILSRLYHPSMMDLYPKARPNDLGEYQLGSPRINSVRNPMAMRAMFRLRKVVNQLLKEKKIDEKTIIHIEFARELNDANRRKAYSNYQRDNEKDKDNCKKEIKELYKVETCQDIEPTDDEILKYQLWKEQNHKCIYTGKEIAIHQFIGQNPLFDIEHTIPQSLGGDSTKMNLTLCDSHYNRDIKGAKLPSKMPEHEEILQRIENWKEEYEKLNSQIRKMKGIHTTTKEQKDDIIQRRHKLEYQRDYWKGKYERFTMTEVPEGFSRRQSTDISVISRYARLYLKSVFQQVYIVKGLATSDFRKIWGIQNEYTKKERINHVHHCIDAIIIACIGKAEYDKLAQYYHDDEAHRWYGFGKANFSLPWKTFVEDIKSIQNEILVSHYTPDNLPKQDKKYIKLKSGIKQLAQGDTARASLHNDTYYGAIEVDGDIKYVVRKKLSSIEEKDIKLIVDDVVRNKIQLAIKEKGIKEALSGPIWMNEEKGIEIKKVRCFCPSVTNPLKIRYQRDLSAHDYKRQYNVTNDRNYMLAIYTGKDKKGKEKKEFELINNLDASTFYKKSNDGLAQDHQLVPIKSKNNYPLSYCLKIGTMVMLYENTPEEIWEGDIDLMTKRLYKVVGITTKTASGYIYGFVSFLHHQEARQSKDLKFINGKFDSKAPFRSAITMLHGQINALVEGYDFEINELGEIKRLK